MPDILVVYHDKIPKYRSKFLQSGVGSEKLEIVRDGDTFTCVTLENWFNPVSFQRSIKSLADFSDNDLHVDASKFSSFEPVSYDAYVFVAPLSSVGHTVNDAAWLFNYCQHYNADAVYTVVDFSIYGNELVSYQDIASNGVTVASMVGLDLVINSKYVQQEYERYLGYRISNDLSEKFKTRLGLSVNQYRIVSDMLLTNASDSLKAKLSYEMDDGATIDLMASVDGDNTSDKLSNLIDLASRYSTLIAYDSKKPTAHTAHELEPYSLLLRWFHVHKGMLYERCVQLAATGLITNPFVSLSSKLVKDRCAYALKLYPNSSLSDKEMFGVWADVSSGASQLIEYNDQLVDLFIDIHDHTVASLFGLSKNVDYRHICEVPEDLPAQITGNVFTKKGLTGTHLPYQNVIPVSYFYGSSTLSAYRCQPFATAPSTFKFWCHHVAPNDLLRELSRLLSKRYVAISPGGTPHLTDFGLAVFALARSMYSDAIPDEQGNQYTTLKSANSWLQACISDTRRKKPSPKLLTQEAKVKGKKRKFDLVLKNSRAGKQVFWKSKTILRGVKSELVSGKIRIRILRNKKPEYQIENNMDALVACSCGEFRSLWRFDAKAKKSFYQCANCGLKRDHYVIFR